MKLFRRALYYRRIFAAYLGKGVSQLTFWHEVPEVNPNVRVGELGEYYMPFISKAEYRGIFDGVGIPMLDYRGAIGPQYNPIAIAQYGLGNYNLWVRNREPANREKFLRIADWLLENLVPNQAGIAVWMHHFDWEYRDTLRSPWYSGLAQGQGISVLVRAYRETLNDAYLEAAQRALESFKVDVRSGGVAFRDEQKDLWFEEYVVDPPTHILNGFIWAAWGLYDFFLTTNDESAKQLFTSAVMTLRRRLRDFDVGFWSLYEQSGKKLPMLASPFYHALHIVQLRVMHKITLEPEFQEFAERWHAYTLAPLKRNRALVQKILFKLCYY